MGLSPGICCAYDLRNVTCWIPPLGQLPGVLHVCALLHTTSA